MRLPYCFLSFPYSVSFHRRSGVLWLLLLGMLSGLPLSQAERISEEQKPKLTVAPSAESLETAPDDAVDVQLYEGIPAERNWKFSPSKAARRYQIPQFAIKDLPKKYDANGMIVERTPPFLLEARSRVDLPPGKYELVIRSLNSSRFYMDDELLSETPFMNLNSSAHNPHHEVGKFDPDFLSRPAAHFEERVTIEIKNQKPVFTLYMIVGNKGRRAEVGELMVAIAPLGKNFRFLSPTESQPFTDGAWVKIIEQERKLRLTLDQRARKHRTRKDTEYWQARHQAIREWLQSQPSVKVPAATAGLPANNAIDHFLNATIKSEEVQPTQTLDDLAFLRKLALDTIGLVPSEAEIKRFLQDPPAKRRNLAIERYLKHPGWADHWVGYWQDVLAENPGMLKPTLNNTGPFRHFLYESFLDRKPFDRFVTELIMMEGSPYYGGSAGFGLATENDVPMAAKAHVLGTAFLAVEMKCARCHDAPYHDVKQADLFSLAALLKRGPQPVPASSSIPADTLSNRDMIVQVTLQPGSKVQPNWPFEQFIQPESSEEISSELSLQNLDNPEDTRQQLALMLTSPLNQRFSQVIVNRVWHRYFGRGIVEPIADWELSEPSHPELLDYLVREFQMSGYDLEHLARLVFQSEAYQRQASSDSKLTATFAAPTRRTMQAEQLLDSLFTAVGKTFDTEELNLDQDGRQKTELFLDLGTPRRAWGLVATSNDRDRPSLSLPKAQSLVDLLQAYGWRQSRPDPITVRETNPTPLQPMALAYGAAPNRVLDLSDQAEITDLCLEEQPLEQLVDRIFQRFLTRPATEEERSLFCDLLEEGYEDRIHSSAKAHPVKLFRSGTTWATHFDEKATQEVADYEDRVLQGDPPTARLNADWRARVEDMLWVLSNTPEFLFLP
ncbi:Cytochrome c domain-containing protein [Planctomycetales bacterium 10988]|nr:Cytochrome c domain-containing protein [Planctomycetales bacterium 10988]